MSIINVIAKYHEIKKEKLGASPTCRYQVLRLPQPEKNPPTLDDGACAGFAGSGVFGGGGGGGVVLSRLSESLEALGPGVEAPPLMIFRKASSLPFVSSSSCFATASAVLAFTSSSSRASCDCAGSVGCAALIDCDMRLLVLLEYMTDAGRGEALRESLFASLRPSLNSLRPFGWGSFNSMSGFSVTGV